jgi:1-acyl-sn-glycerol-3-phosphate acyltransferase
MSMYGVLVVVVDVVLGVVTRRRHEGVANLPRLGPVIVVCNHLSVADPLVLACALRRAGRRATFLVMAEAFRWPVVGRLLRRTGQIAVVRGTATAAEAMAPALAALADGRVVALYPEGRVTTEPDYRPLLRARTGAVRLALAAGCPIVPIAQWGAHDLLDREHRSSLTRRLRWFGWLQPRRVPRRPTVQVAVGPAITVEELRAAAGADRDLRAATDLVMARIRGLLGHIAADDLPDLAPEA